MRRPTHETSRGERPAILPLLIGGLAVYAVVAWAFSVAPVPGRTFLLGIGLAGLCVIPISLWYRQGQQGVPGFECIILCYGLAYSLPVFFLPHEIVILSNVVSLPWDKITQALLLTLAGVAILVGAFYWSRQFSLFDFVPRLDLPMLRRQEQSFIVWAAVISLPSIVLLRSALLTGGLVALGGVVGNLLNVALALLVYRSYKEGSDRIWFYGLAFTSVCLGMASGMLIRAFVPLAVIFTAQWHAKRRFPLVFFLALSLAFGYFNLVKGNFREIAWRGELASGGFLARLQLWEELLLESTLDPASEVKATPTTVWKTALSRVDLLHKFTHVLVETPSSVPYFRGETYKYMVYTWIPRVVWPNKPTTVADMDLVDYSYGLRAEGQTGVKIGIGMIGEAYANFGLQGIFIVMAIQGLIFGLMDRSLNGPNSHAGRAVYLSYMVVFFNGMGANAVIIFGNLLQNIIVTVVIIRFFSPRTNRPGGKAGALPVGAGFLSSAKRKG